ncbi:hypothetical protein Scep_015143 [Stephania cephalantha]|uniref:Uncharacterized protein n=1 Tax=Stephania cephalantha TaxID=152367 RepID=A0AAP0J2D1_9MAGN
MMEGFPQIREANGSKQLDLSDMGLFEGFMTTGKLEPPDLLVTKPLDPPDCAPCPPAEYLSRSLLTKLSSPTLNLSESLLLLVIPSTDPLQFSYGKTFTHAFLDPSLVDTNALYPSLVLCDAMLFANLDALFMNRGGRFVALDLPPRPPLRCAHLMDISSTLKGSAVGLVRAFSCWCYICTYD